MTDLLAMLEIFHASVENVRELKKQRKTIKRLFNQSIKKRDYSSHDLLTKLYALLYSAFAEASFLKTINTPNGFLADEIAQIQTSRNLEQGWSMCIDRAFNRIDKMVNRGEVQNKRQTLIRYLNSDVIAPSQLRNKIAHGQWSVALNSENISINHLTTLRVKNLDFVVIDIHFDLYQKLSQAVEDLIESPYKTHFRDFYIHMMDVEHLIVRTKNWNTKSKIVVLEKKFASQTKESSGLGVDQTR
jgi:hypothetical protein